MNGFDPRSAERPRPDQAMVDIAEYVVDGRIGSPLALDTARLVLLDSMACAMLALEFPECVRHLGPVVPGAGMAGGARVPGTDHELDPAQAAFNIGTLVRWLDFNDTWLAAEWGHPSDNLGTILALADYLVRRRGRSISVGDVLGWAIKAHEVQGVYALRNAFNRVGLDHVILVRLASTAVATAMLGGDEDQVVAAISHAWIDGGPLRTYRHAPNTGPRKSWAAGDACRRAVVHALNAVDRQEVGYPSALTAPTWGFYDVARGGRPFEVQQPFGSYVMENILFKLSFPAEFHAQTAVECALRLYPQVQGRLDAIERIDIDTQEAGLRIIDKTGPLSNPADRDHCLQYMVAVPLVFGRLEATDYGDAVAADPRIDALRARMRVREDARFTREYHDPGKRFIGNAVQVFFTDGSQTDRVSIDYPIGHRLRRAEGLPVLMQKARLAFAAHLPGPTVDRLMGLATDPAAFDALSITAFMDLLVARTPAAIVS